MTMQRISSRRRSLKIYTLLTQVMRMVVEKQNSKAIRYDHEHDMRWIGLLPATRIHRECYQRVRGKAPNSDGGYQLKRASRYSLPPPPHGLRRDSTTPQIPWLRAKTSSGNYGLLHTAGHCLLPNLLSLRWMIEKRCDIGMSGP